MRVLEIDDEAESSIGSAAQNVGRLRNNVFRLDRLAFQLVFGKRLLEARVSEVVIGFIAETSLRDDQRDRLFSRDRRRYRV